MTVFAADDELAGYRKGLGRHARRRRRFLNLTMRDVAARGGPSVVTLRQLEKGDDVAWHPTTLRKLDRALDWVPGSASATLEGGRPSELTLSVPPDRSRPKGVSPGLRLMADIARVLYAAGRSTDEVTGLFAELGLPRHSDLEIHEWMLVAQMLGVTLGTVLTEFNVVTADDLALEFAPSPLPPVPGLREERRRA
jgi:hypothetical protein